MTCRPLVANDSAADHAVSAPTLESIIAELIVTGRSWRLDRCIALGVRHALIAGRQRGNCQGHENNFQQRLVTCVTGHKALHGMGSARCITVPYVDLLCGG